jgi:hypothetical protein
VYVIVTRARIFIGHTIVHEKAHSQDMDSFIFENQPIFL